MLSPQKILIVLIVVGLIWLVFFSQNIPKVSKKLGRKLGEVKDAGNEILSDEEIPGSAISKYETQWGEALSQHILSEYPISQDATLQARVIRIGERLIASAKRNELPYRFCVLESDAINTWAIPGGNIFLTSGMLRLIGGDDNRLAGVIGHEVAHIDKRHAIKDQARAKAMQAGIRLLTLGRNPLLAPVGNAIENFINSGEGYGTQKELEADIFGSELAHKADYSPQAYIRFLKELQAGTPEHTAAHISHSPYAQSHPPLTSRIQELEGRWKAA